MRWLVLVLAAGCSKDLVAELPDAAPDRVGCGKPVVYIDVDGVTIEQGAGADDARTNSSTLPVLQDGQPGTKTVPPPTDGPALRDRLLATFTTLGVTAVATRPTVDDYTMLVVVDQDQLQPAIRMVSSVSPLDCNNQNHFNIVYVNALYATPKDLETAARFGFGASLGLDATTSVDAQNCMRFDMLVHDCTFIDGATVDPMTAQCATTGRQDQLAILDDQVRCP